MGVLWQRATTLALLLLMVFVLLRSLTTSVPKTKLGKNPGKTKEITLPIQGEYSTRVSELENGLVKIYWDLNDMRQDDPTLIQFLKKEILIPPNPKRSLDLKTKPKLNGQFNQVPKVEYVL